MFLKRYKSFANFVYFLETDKQICKLIVPFDGKTAVFACFGIL